MKQLTILLPIFISFLSIAQSPFVKDFGPIREPQHSNGVLQALFLDSNNLAVKRFYTGANGSIENLIFLNSTGQVFGKPVSPPSSWSSSSSASYFKIYSNRLIVSGTKDTVGGGNIHYIELVDTSGNKLWSKSWGRLSKIISVEDSNFVGLSTISSSRFLKLNSKGDTLWTIPASQLTGNQMSDSTLTGYYLGTNKSHYELICKTNSSDTSLYLKIDSSGKILSRELKFLKHEDQIVKIGSGWMFTRVVYDNSGNFPVVKNYSFQFMDSNFTVTRTIPSGYSHRVTPTSIQIYKNQIIFMLQHITDGKYGPKKFTEIQRIDFNGKVVQRNYYRFRDLIKNYMRLGNYSTSMVSLDMCSDNGYYIVGYIADSYDTRSVAIKLDSNGLGIDTVKAPTEGLVLSLWDSVLTDTNVSVNHLLKQSNQVVVFPNPASTWIGITSQTNQELEMVSILNISGQVMYSQKTTNSSLRLDLEQFSNGLYFLEIKNRDGIANRYKFIIEN